MTITTAEQLRKAFARRYRIRDSWSIGVATVTGSWYAAMNVPTNGVVTFPQKGSIFTMGLPATASGLNMYMAKSTLQASSVACGEIHDMLTFRGGLSGTSIAAQTLGVDASDSSIAGRIGESDFSDVQWWLGWNTATGSTGVNATLDVTYNDNSTDTIIIPLAASRPAQQLIPVNSNTAGLFIKSAQSLTLSASTGLIGSFGVYATRCRAPVTTLPSGLQRDLDAMEIGLPRIDDVAALFFFLLAPVGASLSGRAGYDIVQG